MNSSSKILTTDELIEKSKTVLPQDIFDFISGGAGNEFGLENNIHALEKYQIVPRVLRKTGKIDISQNLLQKTHSSPIIIAPCAFHKLACKEGEIATAKAAEKSDAIFTLSTMSSCSIEQVARASDSDKWFQLYIFKDTKITLDLIRRAEENNYRAIVVTVDVPAMGMRNRDIRNKFSLPHNIQAANFKTEALSSISEKSESSKIKEHTDQQFEDNPGWDTMDWICSKTKLPVLLKGILNPEDAAEAMHHNIAGLIISNHGGRQINSVISAIDVLPEIARIVNNKVPLIVDGGIRSGEDIFKAIALGADAVMIGRPILWALSVGKEEEVCELLSRYKNELLLTMRLAGCNSLQYLRENGLSLLTTETKIVQKYYQLQSEINQKNNSEKDVVQPGSTSGFFKKSRL